jgi:hypothetical protein
MPISRPVSSVDGLAVSTARVGDPADEALPVNGQDAGGWHPMVRGLRPPARVRGTTEVEPACALT